ncbi:hypothetical protein HY988_07460 [Candidatus Micrarchaeota archaeon]|nr:hypothetical protein [Candidatus Micrarchaeota archaeon]
MVSKEKYEGKDIHLCVVCGFGYKEKEYAQKCEDFCKAHNSCSMEITVHAVKRS